MVTRYHLHTTHSTQQHSQFTLLPLLLLYNYYTYSAVCNVKAVDSYRCESAQTAAARHRPVLVLVVMVTDQ